MSSSVVLSLCIIWSLLTGSISYTEEVVSYRTYPYGNSYVSSTRGWLHPWNAGPRRSDRPVYARRDTQVRPYTQLVKVEHEQSDPLATISETLGALNTVGNYIVNMTRGVEISDYPPKELPSALYTISKNILGRNVTDSIAPLVRGVALPLRQTIVTSTPVPSVQQQLQQSSTEELINRESAPFACTTAEGGPGKCQNLSNCPQLLLNLEKLKNSFCFKSLIMPGVCCPVDKTTIPISSGSESSGTDVGHRPRPTIRPTKIPTPRPIPLYPVTSGPPTYTIPSPVNNNGFEVATSIDNNLIQDDDECGVVHSGKYRVVGGEETLPGRWPWMAALFLHGKLRTEFWCGGSLIGPRHILTAAHCLHDYRQRRFAAHQFTVRLGDIDLGRDDEPSTPANYQVKKIRSHPEFKRAGFYNDIAILELDKTVRRTPYVIPICLPQTRTDLFVNYRPTVVGWGSTYYGGKESTIQRQVVVPVWPNEECDKTYFQPIGKTFLCAGYKQGGKDACQGDSGGPLMLKINGSHQWTQIGIVSFGNKCGEPSYPGVYTRVTEFIDWIKNNMK